MLPFGICLVTARVPEDYMYRCEVSIRVLRDLLGPVAMARGVAIACRDDLYALFGVPAAPWCLGQHHLIDRFCTHKIGLLIASLLRGVHLPITCPQLPYDIFPCLSKLSHDPLARSLPVIHAVYPSHDRAHYFCAARASARRSPYLRPHPFSVRPYWGLAGGLQVCFGT